MTELVAATLLRGAGPRPARGSQPGFYILGEPRRFGGDWKPPRRLKTCPTLLPIQEGL
jgi:hypothetical protein